MQLLEFLSPVSKYVNNGCCTFRRMLIVIAAVLGLSILTLLFQYYLTRGGSTISYTTSMKRSNTMPTSTGKAVDPNISSDNCWLNEDHVVLMECVQCTEFEKAAGIRPCKPSGHYDKVNCTHAGVVYRSCQRVQRLEERNFIAFILITSICAMTFTFLAHWRQKTLDRLMLQKLQKQLGDGM